MTVELDEQAVLELRLKEASNAADVRAAAAQQTATLVRNSDGTAAGIYVAAYVAIPVLPPDLPPE